MVHRNRETDRHGEGSSGGGGTWLSSQVWARACGPQPGMPTLTAPVSDPALGTIAVLRLPDGSELYGADRGY